MIIRDKDNFLPLIAKMLTALNYDKVEMHTGKPYDITAVKDDKKYYILLDEVQEVRDFESVLIGFLHINNVEIYVTGSNSKFLSSDIVTEFRGRGDEIRVYPLSFAEFYSVYEGSEEKALNELKYHYQNEMLIKEKEITSKYESAIKEKDELINNLQRQRVSMNVKQTGEDLESWCNNEAMQYMQNGFFNCTWEKDNELVGSENTKRSKADYIFKIYSSLNHTEDTLLTSVCLEMKDENPASTNKQTNQYYYKALNENREKKNCKYALLVSNLERDKPNMIPMYKVKEYEDMYVVRPAYMMTFLSMLVSLTKRFEDIINSEEATKLELKSSMDLIAEFNDIKLTYLDKPLTTLNKELETILKNNATISDAARKIEASCEKIATSYINQITSKLDKFELNLNRKVVKKL